MRKVITGIGVIGVVLVAAPLLGQVEVVDFECDEIYWMYCRTTPCATAGQTKLCPGSDWLPYNMVARQFTFYAASCVWRSEIKCLMYHYTCNEWGFYFINPAGTCNAATFTCGPWVYQMDGC